MEATMSKITVFPFQKKLLAIAIGAIITPTATWSINLVQEPLPTSKSAFVAPNVIISIDDSGSMDWGVKPHKMVQAPLALDIQNLTATENGKAMQSASMSSNML
jgi:hypothetical protein